MSMFTCKTDCNGSASGYDKPQAGIGYVGVLALLSILSTLALAFVHQAGTQATANHTRLQHMQSDYLAQSAANHAMWRLLNEPGFSPAPDKYAMHPMAGGRYGYKVRRPGAATMATIATVGKRQDSATQQSYVTYIIPDDVITTYGRAADPLPEYRRLVGAGLSDPADTLVAGSNATYWMDLEGSPLRKEMVMATIDDQHKTTLAVWNGAAWGNQTTLGAMGDRKYKCFDITYESQSGRALAVGRHDASTTAYYNIWDGAAWIHPTAQPAFDIAGGAIQTVIMSACPGNDHILIATISWNNELELFYWDGNTFTGLGRVESSMESDDYGAAQLAYERQSGDALVVWSARGNVRYRIWNGVSLGPENIVSQFADDVFFLRMTPDPNSDNIIVAGADKFYDLTVVLWDGVNWTDSREVAISVANNALPVVDVAWEAAGEDALVAWAPWGKTHVRYFSWEKGTAFSAGTVARGPDLQKQPWLVELQPVSQSEKIVLLAMTDTETLGYSLWSGDQFKGDPAVVLASDITVQNDRAFDLAETEVLITGGTGTGGVATNQPPVVDAGPDQILVWPSYHVQLDGSVSDDGLPAPPGAVTTQWSKISGPDPMGFGDLTDIDTMIKIEKEGIYVFRLTASDGELSAYDDVTIILSSHCNADYTPTTKVSQFSTTSYGSGDTQSLTHLPEGMTFYKATAPAGGALVSVDTADDAINMTDMAGNLLTYTSTATTNTKGVTLVTTGTFADHLATVDAGSNTLTYVDMTGTGIAQLLLSSHGIGMAAGVAFFETTASGTYDSHIAVVDRVTELVYVIDQDGVLKTVIDVNDGTADAVQDVGHLPGADKVIVPYAHEVRIYDFSGTLLRQYDTSIFGANNLESVLIDPNCNHVVADKGADMVMFLTAGGSFIDTHPPNPDPMTWANPPTAVDSTSITMTATSASDASGVQYYFECTAGACHDSGWQTGATYVDSGLSSGTSYTYRVKARDSSDSLNETGWSVEASAATASNAMYVADITMGYRTIGKRYYGRATVRIKAGGGADIEGAVVSGNWSGAVSGTSMGTTAANGQVRLESPATRSGRTVTFTVTSVVKTNYTYTPGMNVETSDSITMP